jgi:hypothetical protein
MSASMNGSDDFADLERQLVSDANRLHERTVEFVDSSKLASETRQRRTRRQTAGAGAFVVMALAAAALTRTWMNNPRPAAVSDLDRPPAVIVPNAAPPKVLAQTPTPPIASDPKVVKSNFDDNQASTSANTPLRPLEFVLTVLDGTGRRAIGRIYCLPLPKDRPQAADHSKAPVYMLTTRRRIKFDELSFVQQDAVRRLLGMEQPVAASVVF